jgi:hypothetical protein
MSRRDPPRYTQNMMADHLRRTHHVPVLNLAEVGMRKSSRRQCLLRWHEPDQPDDLLGVWYRCERCRQTHGEGWDRYYAAVYWPWPLPHHHQAVALHYHESHPGIEVDLDRVSSPGSPVSDWQASFTPLSPEAAAGFLCAACRPAEEPRLAPQIQIGTPAYGDARRLRALRAARTDLRADLTGRTPLQQAELLEARDRELLLSSLHPTTVHATLAKARTPDPEPDVDYLEAAMISILTGARDRGDKPTPVINALARMAKERPQVFTTTVGRAIPMLAAQENRQSPTEFRRSVRTLLNTGTAAPTISERRLWDIWIQHVRDAE